MNSSLRPSFERVLYQDAWRSSLCALKSASLSRGCYNIEVVRRKVRMTSIHPSFDGMLYLSAAILGRMMLESAPRLRRSNEPVVLCLCRFVS